MKLINLKEIKSQKPFNAIFSKDEKVITAIKENMELYGFDEAFPIILWNNIIIDGHQRYEAAQKANLSEVATISYDFDNEQAAIKYAIHNQRDRRNLTDIELLRCVEILDKIKDRGGDHKSDQFKIKNLKVNYCSEPTATRTAELLGIGTNKVNDARTVLDES